MAAEVLAPQNHCFTDRVRLPPPACPRRRYAAGGYTQARPYTCNSRRPVRPEQRKRVGSIQLDHRPFSSRSRSADDLKSVANTEKVTILRRGESLDWTNQEKKARVTARSDTYAGSAFAVSPSPSSLPLPSFPKKKQILVDDSASRDLRRLLRLEI